MFRLSCRLKIPVRELEQRITYRDLLDYNEFFEQELEVPSRMDYYLMLIAHGISRLWSKKGKKLELKDFKLTFKQKPKEPPKPVDPKAHARTWIGMITGGRSKK